MATIAAIAAAPIGAAVIKGFAIAAAAPVEVAPAVALVPEPEAVEVAPEVALVPEPEAVEVAAPAVTSRALHLTDSGAMLVLESMLEVETVMSPEDTVNATLQEQETDSEVWVKEHSSTSVIIPVAPRVWMLYSPDML
jgi:hypothetical protein